MFRLFYLCLPFFIFILSCEEYANTESIWPPLGSTQEKPVILSVSPPADSAFAGYSTVTIHGENFSSDSGGNAVYMGGVRVELESESSNEIALVAPDVAGDTIVIKVTVDGSLDIASYTYRLQTLSEEYGGFTNADKVRSIAMDMEENLYTMMSDRTVRKIQPNGDWIEFGTTTFPVASEMRIGPNGYLYLQKISQRVLFRIPPVGGEVEEFASFPNTMGGENLKLNSFDFDVNGNIYLGGLGGGLVLLRPDGTIEGVGDHVGFAIKSVRIYNDCVYVAGEDGIYRNQIQNDGLLSVKELIFDWENAGTYSSSKVKSITFSETGQLFIGTDNSNDSIDPILILSDESVLEPLYPGQLLQPAHHLLWGNDIYMYVNRYKSSNDEIRRVIKVNMLKNGAPYHGRQ